MTNFSLVTWRESTVLFFVSFFEVGGGVVALYMAFDRVDLDF